MVTTALPSAQKVLLQQKRTKSAFVSWLLHIDRWLLATLAAAIIAGISAFGYYFAHNDILLYSDSYSHMLIARRVIDNVTPGLAQFGAVWLPLPHIIMMPFIYSDYLWRTGLAGSFSSIPCFIIAAGYLYAAINRLTSDGRASFLGSLVFILNPNMLYLQSTPLSEPVLIATMTAAGYYFIVWAQEDQQKYLVACAFTTLLATMARYDGWPLFLTMWVLIGIIGLKRKHTWQRIQSNYILFTSLGGLGIALWFVWNMVIFGDPLYFQHGPYSSQAQQASLILAGQVTTYHNLFQSIRYFLYDVVETMGPALFALALISMIIYFVRKRFSINMLAALPFLIAFPFYIYALYGGQDIILVPGAVSANAVHQLYNARFGVEALTPAALFLATAIKRWPLGQIAFIIILAAQTIITANGGIISLQDGQYGLSCSPVQPVTGYLAAHYNGGYILNDPYQTLFNYAGAGLDNKDVITQGSGKLWTESLQNPAGYVSWIVTKPGDAVWNAVNVNGSAFTSQFQLMLTQPNGVQLYYRVNSGQITSKPLPSYVQTTPNICNAHS